MCHEECHKYEAVPGCTKCDKEVKLKSFTSPGGTVMDAGTAVLTASLNAVDYDVMLAVMTMPEKQVIIPENEFLAIRKPASLNTVHLFRGIKVQVRNIVLAELTTPQELVTAAVNLGRLGRHWSDRNEVPRNMSRVDDKCGYRDCTKCYEDNSAKTLGLKVVKHKYSEENVVEGCENCSYYERMCSQHKNLFPSYKETWERRETHFSILFEADVKIDDCLDRDTPEAKWYAQSFAIYDYNREQEVTVRHGSRVNIKRVSIKGPHVDMSGDVNIKAIA